MEKVGLKEVELKQTDEAVYYVMKNDRPPISSKSEESQSALFSKRFLM